MLILCVQVKRISPFFSSLFYKFYSRGKNKKERLVDMFSSFQKTTDEFLLSNTQKDIDDFFEAEKTFMITYHQQLKVIFVIDFD